MIDQKIIIGDWAQKIKLIQPNTVDVLVTDPPYGMDYKSNRRKTSHKKIANDGDLKWLPKWVKALDLITKEDAHLYIFCSWHHVGKFKAELSKRFNIKNILIWVKNNHGSGDLDGDYAPKYEMIIFCSNGKKKLNGKRIPNVLHCAKTDNDLHPTQKPGELIRLLIDKSSKKGDLIVDTFAGSCIVAIIAREMERNCVCIEIESSYAEFAQKRIVMGATKYLFS